MMALVDGLLTLLASGLVGALSGLGTSWVVYRLRRPHVDAPAPSAVAPSPVSSSPADYRPGTVWMAELTDPRPLVAGDTVALIARMTVGDYRVWTVRETPLSPRDGRVVLCRDGAAPIRVRATAVVRVRQA